MRGWGGISVKKRRADIRRRDFVAREASLDRGLLLDDIGARAVFVFGERTRCVGRPTRGPDSSSTARNGRCRRSANLQTDLPLSRWALTVWKRGIVATPLVVSK